MPLTLLASCATYAPEPLNDRPDLAPALRALVVSSDEFPLRQVGTHRFDIRRPLEPDDDVANLPIRAPDGHTFPL